MQEKRTLYLAGKITGDPYYFTKFYNAQKKLEEGGFIVVNPALLPAEGFNVGSLYAYVRRYACRVRRSLFSSGLEREQRRKI